jgi:hypothetical protein
MGDKVKPWHAKKPKHHEERQGKRISPLRSGNDKRISPLRTGNDRVFPLTVGNDDWEDERWES